MEHRPLGVLCAIHPTRSAVKHPPEAVEETIVLPRHTHCLLGRRRGLRRTSRYTYPSWYFRVSSQLAIVLKLTNRLKSWILPGRRLSLHCLVPAKRPSHHDLVLLLRISPFGCLLRSIKDGGKFQEEKANFRWKDVRMVLCNWRLYLQAYILLCTSACSYGMLP